MNKILLVMLLALPFMFSSCSDDDDKSYKQSYSHRIGEMETSRLTFYYSDGSLPKNFLNPREDDNYKIDDIDVDGHPATLQNTTDTSFDLLVSGNTSVFSVGKTVTITVKWSRL